MTQRTDAFSRCTPAVNFIFFMLVIVFSVIFMHPVYLAVSAVCSVCYYLTIKGRRGIRPLLMLLPLWLLVALINPIFNTRGLRPLFMLFGWPYTLEALLYGAAIGAMCFTVIVWFLCYSEIMTSDKFTSLFGNLIPSLSLLLVMILRLVPSYQKKTAQIAGARRCIGQGVGNAGTRKQKLRSGIAILSAMTSWALESSIITSDSMRSRGYGTAQRSSFRIYRFSARDALLLALMLLAAAAVIAAATSGATAAAYTPVLTIAPIDSFSAAGLAAYAFLMLIPTLFHLWEAITWRILISKI